MNSVDKHKNIPVNDYRKSFDWQNNYSEAVKLDFIVEGRSVFSKIQPPENSCCFGNIVKAPLITALLYEIMNLAGAEFLDQSYEIMSLEIKFIKPLYVENIIKAEGKIAEQKKSTGIFTKGFIYDETKELCAASCAEIMFKP